MPAVDAATERQEASARSPEAKAIAETRTRDQPSAERNGTLAAAPPAKRRGRKPRAAKAAEDTATPVSRFFLVKNGTNGTPELDREVEDENSALIESLKTGGTFIILSEWRPAVDNATKGRPIITKEAVSRSK
jgi:hypothetical protein